MASPGVATKTPLLLCLVLGCGSSELCVGSACGTDGGQGDSSPGDGHPARPNYGACLYGHMIVPAPDADPCPGHLDEEDCLSRPGCTAIRAPDVTQFCARSGDKYWGCFKSAFSENEPIICSPLITQAFNPARTPDPTVDDLAVFGALCERLPGWIYCGMYNPSPLCPWLQ